MMLMAIFCGWQLRGYGWKKLYAEYLLLCVFRCHQDHAENPEDLPEDLANIRYYMMRHVTGRHIPDSWGELSTFSKGQF